MDVVESGIGSVGSTGVDGGVADIGVDADAGVNGVGAEVVQEWRDPPCACPSPPGRPPLGPPELVTCKPCRP